MDAVQEFPPQEFSPFESLRLGKPCMNNNQKTKRRFATMAKIRTYASEYQKLSTSELDELVRKSKYIVQIKKDYLSMARAITVGLARINKLSLLTDKLSDQQKSQILKKFRPHGPTKQNIEGAYEVIRLNKCNIQTNLAIQLYDLCHINPHHNCEIQNAKNFEEGLGKIHLHILDGNNKFNLIYPVTWRKNEAENIYLLRCRNEQNELHYHVITRGIERFR